MKPEEIIYNSVLKLDPNYATTLNDFSVSIYNNRELLEGLSEDLYNTSTPELDKAIDDIRSTYATGQGQNGEKLDKRVVAYSPSQNQRTVYEYQEVEQLLGTPGYNYDTVEDYVGAQNATSGQKWTIEDPNLATQLEEFEVVIDQPEVDAAKQRKEERENEKEYKERVKKAIPLSLFTRNEKIDSEAQANSLTSYLQKLFPNQEVKKGDTAFTKDQVFITGLGAEQVVLDLNDANQSQVRLLDTLLSLDKEAFDIENLENIINQEQTDFESLTAFDDTAEKGMFSIPTDVLSYVNDMVTAPDLFDVSSFKVEEKRDDTDIFSGNLPVAESTASRSNTFLINSSGVQPYQNELDQARLELLNSGVDFTQDDIEKRAREIIKEDYLKKYRAKQFEKYVEGDIDGVEGLSEKQIEDLKFKSRKQKDELGSKIERRYDLLKEYSEEIDNFGLNKDGSLKSNNKFSSSGFYYTNLFNEFINNSSIEYNIKPGQEYYRSKDGRNIPTWLYDGHVKEVNRFKELGDLIATESEKLNEDVKKLKSSEQQFDIIRKNYNDVSKFGVSLGLATLDLVTSTAYGIYKLQQYVNPIALAMKTTKDALGFKDPVDQAMMALKNWEEDVRDDYKEDIRYNDINSWSDVGQYTYQSIANQAPLIVSMIATGGLSGAAAKSAGITGKALQTIANVSSSSMVGLSSFGGKFSDMSYEEFKTGKDLYSDAEILFKSIGYGVSEGAFAYLSTAPLLNKGVGKMAGISDDLLERELAEGFKQEISKHVRKDILPETLGEMFFEGLTTGTQNLIDGRPFLENMKETIVSSGFWGAGMSGIPSLYVAGTKNFTGNKELNIINKSTSLANELRRKNSALINAMNSDGGLMTKEKLQSEIDSNNKLIEKYEADAVDAYLTVEENVREEGMLPDDATNFIEGQINLADLREEAFKIQSDATKSKQQKSQELELVGEIYNQAKKGMELFNNTETFGSPYGALMMAAAGKDRTNKKRKEYNEITAEAKRNLLDINRRQKNPKANYNPTGAEIATEADNVLFEKQMDKQLDKDRKQSEKLGHTFIDFESREQAGKEVAEAFDVAIELEDNASKKAQLEVNKAETLAAINRGSLNGGSISTGSGGFFLDFVVRENMTKNKRFTSGLHENTHSISRKLLKNNPEAFKNLGDQILKYLVYTNQTDALKAMNASNANLALDGEFDYDEVISSFVELIAEDKVDLDKMDNFKAANG